MTSFILHAHPDKMIICGPSLWPVERVEELMARYETLIHNAPEGLNGFMTTMIFHESLLAHMHLYSLSVAASSFRTEDRLRTCGDA